MMIKKVEISFGREPKGAKNMDFGGILRFKQLFCQSAPTSPTKRAEMMLLGVLQHPTKFQAEILTQKLNSWIKSKNPLGVLAIFYFGHNSQTP